MKQFENIKKIQWTERENSYSPTTTSGVLDLSLWRNKKIRRKALSKINELVIIPVAVFAVLVS